MISKEEVKHIAKLARLDLSEKKVEKMQKDLSSILDYFNILKEASSPLSGSPEHGFLSIEKATRKNEAMPKISSLANNLVAQAPEKKDGYIKVKAVL